MRNSIYQFWYRLIALCGKKVPLNSRLQLVFNPGWPMCLLAWCVVAYFSVAFIFWAVILYVLQFPLSSWNFSRFENALLYFLNYGWSFIVLFTASLIAVGYAHRRHRMTKFLLASILATSVTLAAHDIHNNYCQMSRFIDYSSPGPHGPTEFYATWWIYDFHKW